MTNEELVALIQAGDTAHLPTLWEQVEKFVRRQAERRVRALNGAGGVDSDDLYQAGYLALLDAVDGYKPEAGKSFISYLAYFLRSAFAEAAGYRTSKRNPLDMATPLDAPIAEDEAATLLDTLADPVDPYEEVEDAIWREQLRAELDKAFDSLPPDQGEALRRRYLLGHTQRQIAVDMGVSSSRIQQREAAALRTLRAERRRRRGLAQFVEQRTDYYKRVGVAAFHATHTSAVEWAVLEREWLARHAMAGPC